MAPVRKPLHRRRRHFLRDWRDFRDISQEDAADRAEISRSSLSKIESGKVPYNQDLLERLAVIYNCEPDDLIAINPNGWDGPRMAYDALKRAPLDIRNRAIDALRAFLKTGA